MRTITSLLATIVVMGSVPAAAIAADRVDVVAHRGASGEAPENTLAAIREAGRQDADWVEIDVVLSKDGVPVLLHDTSLARTTDVEEKFPDREPWLVEDFTVAELKQLDAGSWFDERFAGEPLPTFREALLALDKADVGLWLEIKSPERYPGVEEAIAEVLRTTPGGWLTAPDRAEFFKATSFNFDSLRKFAEEIDNAVPVGGISSTVPDDAALREHATWMEFFIVDHLRLQENDIDRIEAAGLKTAFWTVNDPEVIVNLAQAGANAVIGNYPESARRALMGMDPFPSRDSVVIDELVNNPPGDDVQPENGEHVVLRNVWKNPVRVGGWYMRDAAYNLLPIAEGYRIPAGGTLRVYVGPGTSTADRLYLGRSAAVLNNGGDSIALHRPDHSIVDLTSNDLTP
ncbi:MAG TPA: glycerophosphodiester phosphodiesterase family protein [Solirubrobacter sp.]|nr:glycerophosphodiester phosphodiesterase family protein [Solirubrobacter sp.]